MTRRRMIRFAADENLNNDIVRALRRRLPEVDIARVQDAELGGAPNRQGARDLGDRSRE